MTDSDALPETMPASWYADAGIYRRERQAIFWKNWSLVARRSQFERPGDYVAAEVAGWPVFVIQGKDGQLAGFHNVCRHRAGPLFDDGAGNCSISRCMYHGWLYDVDGRLRRAPGLEICKQVDSRQFGLHAIRVDTWNGLVFACLDRDGPALDQWLGDIVEIARGFPMVPHMTYSGNIVLNGHANWKTYCDNSCEGYHVSTVHKGLSKALNQDEVNIAAYHNGCFVGFDVTYRSTDADTSRHGRGFWIYKFPCLLMHFCEFAFNVERIMPQGPGAVKLERWFWCDDAKAASAGANASEAMASARQVIGEDLAICERVQRNLEAGVYDHGVMSGDHEAGTIYFQQLVRRALG